MKFSPLFQSYFVVCAYGITIFLTQFSVVSFWRNLVSGIYASSLKRLLESGNAFEIKNTAWDILVSGVGSMYDTTSDGILLS